MNGKIARDVRLLKVYAVITTFGLVVLFLSGFHSQRAQKVGVIDAQRINIVEPDGRVDMVLTDKAHFPPPVWKGKPINVKRRGAVGRGVPGIVFYNSEGTEDGGLAFMGRTKNGKTEASAALTFDQYNQDQIISMGYDENNGARTAALQVWERPNTPLIDLIKRLQSIQDMPTGPAKQAAQERLQQEEAQGKFGGQTRVFVGRNAKDASEVILSDAQGKPRIRMTVERNGESRLQFLNAEGKVIYCLPPRGKE